MDHDIGNGWIIKWTMDVSGQKSDHKLEIKVYKLVELFLADNITESNVLVAWDILLAF